MLKFVTDENLEALESNTVWHAKQSALESMSRFILPNFTIHAVDNVRTVPSVFFLLQNKSEKQYIRTFRQLKEMNPGLEPSRF